MAVTASQKRWAKQRLEIGESIADTAERMGISKRSLYRWKNQEGWELKNPKQALEAEIMGLLNRVRTPEEEALLDKNIGRLMKISKTQAILDTKHVRAEKRQERQEKKEERVRVYKNDVRHIDFQKVEKPQILAYQQKVLDDPSLERIIKKSRMIGFSFVFSWEALWDACTTGRNQVFLSASQEQVFEIREYIREFARHYLKFELTGQRKFKMRTKQGTASIYFLAKNPKHAQSRKGNVYIDEGAFIDDFSELYRIASGMAAHAGLRITIFSATSTKHHPFSCLYDQRDKNGKPEPNNFSRHKITLYDAIAQGCNFFDVEKLKVRYSESVFRQLFLCEEVDDMESFFTEEEFNKCAVSVRPHWTGGTVWIGVDPSRKGDLFWVTFVEYEAKTRTIKVIEEIASRNKTFEEMGRVIAERANFYRASYLAIDSRGVGLLLWDDRAIQRLTLIKRQLMYDGHTKTELVLRLKRLVQERRLKIHAENGILRSSFLAIKTIRSGTSISFDAGRNADTGHADPFWALANAISNEPFKQNAEEMIIR